MSDKKNNSAENPNDSIFPDNTTYPPSEDIYNNNIETDLNPEDTSQEKKNEFDNDNWNEKDFDEDQSGADLDVPGSELDDEQEELGSEDEENNYYSTGGDNHNDLEEGNEI
jgi:hypothetical protein